jgi:hypothetical protein
MNTVKQQHMSLNINEVRKIAAQRSGKLSVFCQEGLVWVTVLGDPKDYILKSGEEVEFKNEKGIVVQSLSKEIELEIKECA